MGRSAKPKFSNLLLKFWGGGLTPKGSQNILGCWRRAPTGSQAIPRQSSLKERLGNIGQSFLGARVTRHPPQKRVESATAVEFSLMAKKYIY